MIQIALITNNKNTNVGIVGSDTTSGRIVYKFIPSAQFCADLIDTWVDRSLISESIEESKDGDFNLRTKIVSNEEEYLGALLAKTINPPYSVKYIEKLKQGSLSNTVEKEFNELI